jgi:hypothetical protein
MSKANSNTRATHDVSSGRPLDLIHRVILEEICALRRDVDTIGHGRWSVNISPFQHAKEGDTKATDAFKARILEKLGVILGDPPLTFTMTPHDDHQKLDSHDSLS